MSYAKKLNKEGPELITSSRPFFKEMVQTAIENCQIKSPPLTQIYLVDLLEYYLLAGNMPTSVTLAEMFLTASSSEPGVRADLLRKLGDVALYTSGFFGDSLQRKLVDIDYYAEIGGTAYSALAHQAAADEMALVFDDLSNQFLKYVDALTYISQQALVQTNEDILRLYARYLTTGSRLAEEQLVERGVLNFTASANKSVKQ